ncbi:MAG: putative bifunctional diguanylate cyclase/phosphodiesterase [Lachnospiraceae bacterium]
MDMGKMLQYIMSRKDTIIFQWTPETGWKSLTECTRVLKDCDLEHTDLFQLKNWVEPEDQAAFQVFLNQVQALIDGNDKILAPEEKKVSIAVRFLEQSGRYAYQNLNCWVERENGVLIRMFAMSDPLNAEEVYRLKVAQVFTADQDPSIFMKQVMELIQTNPDKKYAVIQFDIAKFKMIIADFGEKQATDLLNYFVTTLKVICNQFQIYTRLSSDIFMVVTPYKEKKELLEFVEYLDSQLRGYKGMHYRVVYGICPIGDLKNGFRQYGDAAAMARQSIKMNVLEKVAFYSDTMKENISTSKFIEDHMDHALENHEFVMFLQPKCMISDGSVIGAEALVRWVMPGHGIVPPNEFIPVFEKNGFVIKMDQYIWEEACKRIRKWIDAGISPLPISINVSRKHLRDTKFIDVLDGLVAKYDIPRHYLEIEITETVDESGIEKNMNELKQHGYTLLMDDFGSGYSSLNTLKDTKFDIIKMDRMFLNDFISSDRGKKIVKHMVNMTKEIGLDMVAEGVETKEEAEFLRNCGCDTAQGFYYARPMPADEFEEKYLHI